MKTKMTGLAVMIVALVLVAWAASAWAEGAGTGCAQDDSKRFERAQRIDKIVDELGLSPAQREELKKQRADLAGRSKESREKMQVTRAALKAELDKPTLDTARVNGLTADLKTLVCDQIQNRVDHVVGMKKILTPEQFSKMKTLIEERRQDHMSRKGARIF